MLQFYENSSETVGKWERLELPTVIQLGSILLALLSPYVQFGHFVAIKIEQFKQLHISTYCSQYTISITEILARLVRSSISVWYIRELVHYISGVWFVLQPYICIHIFITTSHVPPPPTHTHLHTFTASRAFLLSSWILVEIICSKTTCA